MLFRLFSTFRYVPVVLATLHFETAWKAAILSNNTRKLRFVSKSYASYGEGPSTVYCPQSNTRTTRARGRGELSPPKLSTILSTLQYSLQCSGRTTCSICTVVSTMQHNSLYNPLYLESLLTITFSLPRSYHFVPTFILSSPSLSRYC